MFALRDSQVDDADPAFPRASAYWWFGCKSAGRGTLGNFEPSYDYRKKPSYYTSKLHEELIKENLSEDSDDRGDVGDIILDAGI